MTHMRPIQSERPLADWLGSMNTAQKIGLLQLPIVSDVAGLLGDIQQYREEPESRGLLNYSLTGLGLLPLFPNMTVLAPGDEHDLGAMLDWARAHDGPVAIRYPKAVVERQPGPRPPLEFGRAELLAEGHDGLIVACGTLLGEAVAAAAHPRPLVNAPTGPRPLPKKLSRDGSEHWNSATLRDPLKIEPFPFALSGSLLKRHLSKCLKGGDDHFSVTDRLESYYAGKSAQR